MACKVMRAINKRRLLYRTGTVKRNTSVTSKHSSGPSHVKMLRRRNSSTHDSTGKSKNGNYSKLHKIGRIPCCLA